jgi:UDP-glucose 4-epimerase
LRAFVTGAAIGSNLVDRLLELGYDVTGFDYLSTGFEVNLARACAHPNFRLVRGDLLDAGTLRQAMEGRDTVFHLAANADVRFGTEHPRKDLEQNTIATFNVLEAMRLTGAFRRPDLPTVSPTSFRLRETPRFRCKLLSTALPSSPVNEGLIQAYAGFGINGFIFRFVSILGERYSHGHIISSISTINCASIPTSCTSSAMAARGNRICTCRIASPLY